VRDIFLSIYYVLSSTMIFVYTHVILVYLQPLFISFKALLDYKPGWILNPGPGGVSVRQVKPSKGSAA